MTLRPFWARILLGLFLAGALAPFCHDARAQTGTPNLDCTLAQSNSSAYVFSNQCDNAIDNAVNATVDLPIADADATLPLGDVNTGVVGLRSGALVRLTGANTATRTYTVPAGAQLELTIENATGQAIVIAQSGGASFTIGNGVAVAVITGSAGLQTVQPYIPASPLGTIDAANDLCQFFDDSEKRPAHVKCENLPGSGGGGPGGGTGGPLDYAVAILTTNQVVPNTGADLVFQSVVEDTNNFWSPSNPTRLTVGAGIDVVELCTMVFADTANSSADLRINKNGAPFDGMGFDLVDTDGANVIMTTCTAPVSVAENDYFTAFFDHSEAGNLTVGDPTRNPWFSIKVLEPAPGGSGLRYGLVRINANQNITNGAWTAISWNAAVDDALGIWSAGAPTRLTVPADSSRVELSCQTEFTNSATGAFRLTRITKMGAPLDPNPILGQDASDASAHINQVETYVLQAAPGDWYECEVLHDIGAGNGVVNTNDATWFQMKVLQ